MSKISATEKAIEALEKAEEALTDARRAFYGVGVLGGPSLALLGEYKIIDSIFEGVGDAKEILQHRILAPLEKAALDAIKEKNCPYCYYDKDGFNWCTRCNKGDGIHPDNRMNK